MDYFDLIRQRESMREFQDKEVSQEQLDAILETIQLAPSAGNLQAFKVAVVRDKEVMKELGERSFSGQDFTSASVMLVFCAWPDESAQKYEDRGRELFSVQDATIACAHAQLAAQALGLSSVWVGAIDEPVTQEILQLDPALRPVAVLPIGYAHGEAREHDHKPLDEIML